MSVLLILNSFIKGTEYLSGICLQLH